MNAHRQTHTYICKYKSPTHTHPPTTHTHTHTYTHTHTHTHTRTHPSTPNPTLTHSHTRFFCEGIRGATPLSPIIPKRGRWRREQSSRWKYTPGISISTISHIVLKCTRRNSTCMWTLAKGCV